MKPHTSEKRHEQWKANKKCMEKKEKLGIWKRCETCYFGLSLTKVSKSDRKRLTYFLIKPPLKSQRIDSIKFQSENLNGNIICQRAQIEMVFL